MIDVKRLKEGDFIFSPIDNLAYRVETVLPGRVVVSRWYSFDVENVSRWEPGDGMSKRLAAEDAAAESVVVPAPEGAVGGRHNPKVKAGIDV